ncbi:MAG: ABC transporter substrate-binding protein [Synergistaceae bacterium]
MKKKNCFSLLVIALFLLFADKSFATPKRIVSITPTGTELIYALGLDENLLAVTTFCDYPPEAAKKEKIGGFASMNFEYLVAKKVDLVLIQDLHSQFVPQLKQLKIPYVMLRNDSISNICKSILEVGSVCGKEKEATRIVASINSDVRYVYEKLKKSKKPKVLVCISRELSGKKINSFYAAGKTSFYNEMIEKSGGINAMQGNNITYPVVSQEGLMLINPDVIADMIGDSKSIHSAKYEKRMMSDKEVVTQWKNGVRVEAIKKNKIVVLRGNIFLRPGPRVGTAIIAFAKAIHPEASWDKKPILK